MDWLIWSGAAVSAVGIAGIVWCILLVARARRANLADAALRARMQRAVMLNLAALLVSAFGLMMVITGIFLG